MPYQRTGAQKTARRVASRDRKRTVRRARVASVSKLSKGAGTRARKSPGHKPTRKYYS